MALTKRERETHTHTRVIPTYKFVLQYNSGSDITVLMIFGPWRLGCTFLAFKAFVELRLKSATKYKRNVHICKHA